MWLSAEPERIRPDPDPPRVAGSTVAGVDVLEPGMTFGSASERWLLVMTRLKKLPEKMEGGSQKMLTFWRRFSMVKAGSCITKK